MDHRKHICFCYHVYPPIIGGVELCIEKLASYLIKKGHKVTVVCSDRNKMFNGHKNEEIINGVRVIYVKSYFELMKVPFLPAYEHVLSTIKPDLIHAYGSMPGVSDIAIFHAKRKKIPSLLTYQFDGNSESTIGNISAWIYNNAINKIVVKNADRIISTGKSYAETSPVLKDVLDKVSIIPNGIDLNRFNPNYNKKNIRIKYDIPKGKIVLWVGRFVKYKGLEYLIRAMTHVENATLVIVGSGKLENSLKLLVKQNNLTQKIKFLGYIKNSELPGLYCLSDIYVLSSITRGENFGISILESMGCGTPIIASNLPGVRDLVTDDVGIKVEPKNILELAKKINFLLSDKQLREKMGLCGIKRAKSYSWESISRKVYNIYEELWKKIDSVY